MPEEEKEAKKLLPETKKKFPLLLIVGILIAVAICLVVSAIVANKVSTRVGKEDLELLIRKKKEKPKPPPPLHTFKLDELSAQLQDIEEERFVILRSVSLAFKKEHEKLKEELKEREPQIKDMINTILMTKTSDELRTANGKKALKTLLTNKINEVLSGGKIEDVYCEVVIR